MEQRRETRFTADQPIRIIVIGPPDLHLAGRVKNASGRGMGIEVSQRIDAGTALKLALDDAILLGEAIFCRDDGGSFYVGIEVEHALYGLAELARIMSDFSEEDSGSERRPATNRTEA